MDMDITELSQVLPLIMKYHGKYKGIGESNMDNLIKTNPSLEKLMVKAQGLLQIKLLEWADVVGQVALIDQQLTRFVRETRELESDLLVDYAEWVVSHDHAAVAGLMEKMRSLVKPIEYGRSNRLLEGVMNSSIGVLGLELLYYG
ncbi:hypothetical protein HF086_006191 [Spodoptera exigua]|uniref:Uncharacterized protein n=1 Tax=Spodoptera exigua TaxID=7107 RepID=A0A922MDG1_SPOEX|nr:hypothetical protein HF086_006191 [Spodoptera exigua]